MFIDKKLVEWKDVMLSDDAWVEMIEIARYQIEKGGSVRYFDTNEINALTTLWLYGLLNRVLGEDIELIKMAMEMVWNPFISPRVIVLGIHWKFEEDIPEEIENEIAELQEEWFQTLEENGYFDEMEEFFNGEDMGDYEEEGEDCDEDDC